MILNWKLFILFIFLSLLLFFPKKVLAADITSSWSSSTSLPYNLASHVSFSSGDKISIIGGSAATGYSRANIISATVDSTGTLNSWSDTGNFPIAPIWHALAYGAGRVYVLGGLEENSGSANEIVSKVYLGVVDASGTVSEWVPQPSLPSKLALGAAVIVGDRIFYSGGFNASGASKKVYSAPINDDGSLGAWGEAGEMPEPKYGHGMIEMNNALIVLGGYNGGAIVDTNFTSSVNQNGTLSSFQQTTSFPEPVYRASMIRVGATLLSVGGNNGNPIDKIYYTTINNDGTLQQWVLSSNRLPSPVQGAALALVDKYLYLLGGYDGGYLNTVYTTTLSLETSLNVPLLKQTNPSWGSQLYDSANIWSPTSQGISAWGCALTAAAMVFNYHGINKLPDGTNLDPGTLNTWLKGQTDGYVGNGFVNWLALSRLSKLAKSQNPNFLFDALEYRRTGYDASQLTNDLKQNIPGILGVPGHFIVGKGIEGSSFSINDTLYDRTSLTSYSNTFSSLGRYIPSNTDLSYIMLVLNDGVTLTVKDGSGNVVGEGFTQSPLDEDGGNKKNGPALRMYYVPTPSTGQFAVEVSGVAQMQYTLQTFLYDKNGNVKKIIANGVAGGAQKDTFTISFDKQNSNLSNIAEKVTFDNLLADIDYLYSKQLIAHMAVHMTLRMHTLNAKGFASRNDKKTSIALLKIVGKALDVHKGKLVKEEAYQIMKPQVEALIKTLQ